MDFADVTFQSKRKLHVKYLAKYFDLVTMGNVPM
jgi:hypothetical protein